LRKSGEYEINEGRASNDFPAFGVRVRRITMKIRWSPVLILVFLFLALVGCQRQGEEKTAGTVPIKVALAAGRSPVEIGSVVPLLVSPVAPTFKVTVKNVTDAPLDSIFWTAVVFDENGNSLPEGEVEGGYADPLNPILAGEASELSFMIQDEKARSVKLVLKEVIYKGPNPMGKKYGDLPYKWTNPFYEAELKTARGISVPE
jgi:hypothetical protein